MKKTLSILFFYFIVLLNFQTMALNPNVIVRGTAVNGAGKVVDLYGYTDRLTFSEKLLDSDEIKADQSFELKMFVNYPTLIFIQIENYSQSFFVEPGRTYELYIRRFDWDLDEHRNVFLQPEPLPVEFLNVPSNELNVAIGRIESVIDSFVYENVAHFDYKFKPDHKYFDTLAQLVNKIVPDGDNNFQNRYKRYRLATLRYDLRFATRKKMFDSYVSGQQIMYYDENFMDFFFNLFQSSVSRGNKYVLMSDMVRWVNSGDLTTMLDSLGLDPLLRNEQIRELVALQALKESYDIRGYDRDAVVKMVELLGGRSKFPEHVKLANNLVLNFKNMEVGAEVPEFELPDVDKNYVSMNDFKGKWIYLSFVRVGDPNSLREIETLAHFKDSIYAKSDNVVFITVACDREFQKMYHFLKNNKKGKAYNWTWLHFNGNFKLLEKYEVVNYPTFLLINPDGKLQYNVTPTPASGFLLSPPWQPNVDKSVQRGLWLRNGR